MKKIIYPVLAILWQFKEWLREFLITCLLISLVLIVVAGAVIGFETGLIEKWFLSFGGDNE